MVIRIRTTAALVACVALAQAASAQTLTFVRDDYASSAGARAIVSADFDRNGWPDVAHANGSRNSVSVLLNDRSGRRAGVVDVAVGAGPFDLTTADFNRDGIPDLAVANADGHSISILLGKGDGTFTRSDIAALSQGPRGIAAGDFNNDGKPDLIYSGYDTGVVQLLTGNGAGGFAKGATYASSAAHPQGLATGDFNRDGRLDVAVAYDSATGLRILYGNGGTGFTARTIGGDSYLNVVATGDFNADGWVDVAAASSSGSAVAIYLGSATGPTHTQTAVVGSSPRGIAVADLDADGALDIATANRASNTVSVLRGDAAHPGAFATHIDVAAGTGSRDVVVGDFDGDGRLDLATGNEYAAAATVLSNTTYFVRAAYVFTRRTLGAAGRHFSQYANYVHAADFNRDGKLDVAVARDLEDDAPRSLAVFLNGGATVSLPTTGYPQAFDVADVNGDGNADVVYVAADGAINADLGNGRGAFTAAVPTSTSISPGNPRAFAIGDLNRDGKPDLVFLGTTPGTTETAVVMRVMLGNGDGTFRGGAEVALDWPWLGVALTIVDVNRDGKPDVTAGPQAFAPSSSVQIWYGDGSGGLAARVDTPVFGVTGATDSRFADVNRDGYVDLVVAGDGGIDVELGGADGFGAPVHFSPEAVCGAIPVGYGACWAGFNTFDLADINMDGRLDIVTSGGDLVFGDGAGGFGDDAPFDVGAAPDGATSAFDVGAADLAVAEFSGDGLPDIAYVTALGTVGVLVNERNDVNRPPAVTAGPDITIPYEEQVFRESELISAIGGDPDLHALSFQWRDASGTVVSNGRWITVQNKLPGSYTYTLTASDGRGGVTTDSVVVTIAPTKEIVVHLCEDVVDYTGTWSRVLDDTAASGCRAHDPNLGAPKVTAPLASPPSRVSAGFIVDPTQTYKLWLRLKADGDYWGNDSVWIQFSGSTTPDGSSAYRVGTTSGLSVNLEECSGCGLLGWGWEDDGWGAVNKNGVLLRFPEGGVQYFVIQTREDGVSVDQIVLSSEKYLTTRPGRAKNDTTILRPSYNPF